MAARGLAIEHKAARLQLPNDLSVPKPRKPAHSCGDHDRVVSPVMGSRQVRNPIALAPGFNQFPGDVAGDLERLGDGSPLGYEAGKFIRGRKEKAFWQLFHLYPNREFHTCRS